MYNKKFFFFFAVCIFNSAVKIACNTPFTTASIVTAEEALTLLNEFYESGHGLFLLQRKAHHFLKNTDSIDIVIPEIVNLFDSLQNAEYCDPQEIQIILVHGTFAGHFDWYKEGGDFYESISQAAKEKFGENIEITPFRWTGCLGCMARVEAATELAELMLNTKKKVYTVGHSHGGNVINLASQIIELVMEPTSKKNRVDKITKIAKNLLEKNQQESEKWENTRRGFSEHCNLDELVKTITLNIYSLAKQAIDTLEKEDSERNTRASLLKTNQREICIEENYLLATPVAIDDLAPSKKIVKRSFSFYSKNDLVQPVFGLYGRKYGLPRDVVTDICAIFCHISPDDNSFIYEYPRHTDLHSATIGRALLSIPELCKTGDEELYKNNDNQFNIVFYANFPEFKNPSLETPAKIESSILETWLENLKDFASLFT